VGLGCATIWSQRTRAPQFYFGREQRDVGVCLFIDRSASCDKIMYRVQCFELFSYTQAGNQAFLKISRHSLRDCLQLLTRVRINSGQERNANRPLVLPSEMHTIFSRVQFVVQLIETALTTQRTETLVAEITLDYETSKHIASPLATRLQVNTCKISQTPNSQNGRYCC